MRRTAVGGAAWLSIAHYFVVEALVERRWTAPVPYRRRTNVISDLGAQTCGDFHDRVVCSPAHAWINGSFGLVGAAAAMGAVALRGAVPDVVTRPVLGTYVAAGIGSVLVAAFPEDTVAPLHVLGAAGYFVGANLGHLLIGRRLRRRGRAADRAAIALVALGCLGLTATVLLAAGVDLGLGVGTVERVIVYGADAGFLLSGALAVSSVSCVGTTGRAPAHGEPRTRGNRWPT